jgi:predicted transcriptional regulator of viral defense system
MKKSIMAGIGKKSRKYLARVLTQSKSGLITSSEVSDVLQITKARARRLLQSWEKNEWLFRIQRDLYQPMTLEADGKLTVVEDPWIVADKLFAPCYIGGWTAVEYWNLTEQVFQTIIVVTSHRFSKNDFIVGGIKYRLKMTSQKAFFGLKTVWRNNLKMHISDPTKTIIDTLNDPIFGGGMRFIVDFFKEYLKSEHKSLNLLIEYAEKMKNCTIFKRLGFLIDSLQPNETAFINECKKRISKGRSQFDPTIKGTIFNSKWSLLIPIDFDDLAKEKLDD